MSYLLFNKEELINLEYSLQKEILSTNRAGGYCSTTIILCNTRKYHGLMVLPLKEFDDENHVLLSSVDETIIQEGKYFNLGIHKYPGFGVFEPKGHKYIRDFQCEPTPKITYRVGSVVLEKELLFVHNEEQFVIRYTLIESASPIILRIKPFLAFRNSHKLSKANMHADTKYKVISNGIKSKLYPDFPWLHMQLNKKNEFVASPDWYYNIEYLEEQNRGYDFKEDLFVPGFFEIPMKRGESIIFSASTSEIKTQSLNKKFEAEKKSRAHKNSFENCLKNTAQQFLVQRDNKTEIIAGYPWFGRWGRDTFISLPGLTIGTGNDKLCKQVLDTMVSELKGGLFPNIGKDQNASFNSVDAPLWFFWAVQMYADKVTDNPQIWSAYGKKMKQVLKAFKQGLDYNIKMMDNGLVWQGQKGKSLTWMDAVVEGIPVTPREGYAVEINALWYNAVCYTLQLAQEFDDKEFIDEWLTIPGQVKASFLEIFWSNESDYLFDVVTDKEIDDSVRPNQLFAVSLPFSPLDEEQKGNVLQKIESELLTAKGLRTLSPGNLNYKGRYEGNQAERDRAYHQGTVWPWLLGHFVEAYLKLYGSDAIPFAEKIVNNFVEDMTNHGLCSISEIYDGDPPQRPSGAISQAWSVAEIIRAINIINYYKHI